MPNCPNCGEPVGASATACSECGTSLEGVTEASGGQPADDQAGDAGQPGRTEPQQGGQQPQQGQPPQGGQPSGQPQGGQPNQPPQGGQPNRRAQGGQPNQQPSGGQPNQQPQGGQPRRQPQGGQQPPQGQQPQGGQGYQQPPAGQQYQQGGHPQGAPPRAGQQDGYSRRTLLKVGGGAAVLGGLGLVGYTVLSGGGGPAGTARSFVNALDNGNAQQANELLHDDSPTGEFGTFTASTLEQVDISIESTEVVSQNAERAEVRMDLSVESEGALGGGSSSLIVELRTQNGQWRVWQLN